MFMGFLGADFGLMAYLSKRAGIEGESVTLGGGRSTHAGEVLKGYGLGA